MAFNKYDAENIEAVPLLYQAGYLTIVNYNDTVIVKNIWKKNNTG
jgi:hypothetical protein